MCPWQHSYSSLLIWCSFRFLSKLPEDPQMQSGKKQGSSIGCQISSAPHLPVFFSAVSKQASVISPPFSSHLSVSFLHSPSQSHIWDFASFLVYQHIITYSFIRNSFIRLSFTCQRYYLWNISFTNSKWSNQDAPGHRILQRRNTDSLNRSDSDPELRMGV